MRSGFASRITLGLGSSLANQVLGAIQMFALTPFFIRAWGVDVYGKWIVLSSIISYLSLADFGGQTYIANALAIHFARDDRAAFRRTLSEAVSLFVFFGASLFSGFVLVVVLSMHATLPGLRRPLAPWEAQTLVMLAANFLLLSLPGGVYATAYRATGNFARGATASNLARLSTLAICISILLLGASPREFAAGLLLSGLISTVGILYDLRRSIPLSQEISIGFLAARRARRHLSGAIPFWLIALSMAIGQQGTVLVLALVSSPAVVAVYATHRSVSAISGYIGPTLQAPLLPEFSFLYSRERKGPLRVLTLLAIESNILLTGAIAVLIWCAAPLVFSAWTSHKLDLNPVLLALSLFQGTLASAWSACSWPLLAANRHRLVAACTFVNAAVAILGTSLLAKAFGVIGAPIAALIADLVFGIALIPVLAARFLRVPSKQIYASITKGVGILTLLAGASALLIVKLPNYRTVPLLLVNSLAVMYILRTVKSHLRSGFVENERPC